LADTNWHRTSSSTIPTIESASGLFSEALSLGLKLLSENVMPGLKFHRFGTRLPLQRHSEVLRSAAAVDSTTIAVPKSGTHSLDAPTTFVVRLDVAGINILRA
jgi:hypothetical protein